MMKEAYEHPFRSPKASPSSVAKRASPAWSRTGRIATKLAWAFVAADIFLVSALMLYAFGARAHPWEAPFVGRTWQMEPAAQFRFIGFIVAFNVVGFFISATGVIAGKLGQRLLCMPPFFLMGLHSISMGSQLAGWDWGRIPDPLIVVCLFLLEFYH